MAKKGGRSKQLAVTRDEIIEALEKHRGWITYAAADLNCTQANISQWIKRDEVLREKWMQIKEFNLDFVEKALFIKIAQGDTSAIIFYLKCQGKHRGYIEKEKVVINNNIVNQTKEEIKAAMSPKDASNLYANMIGNDGG